MPSPTAMLNACGTCHLQNNPSPEETYEASLVSHYKYSQPAAICFLRSSVCTTTTYTVARYHADSQPDTSTITYAVNTVAYTHTNTHSHTNHCTDSPADPCTSITRGYDSSIAGDWPDWS